MRKTCYSLALVTSITLSGCSTIMNNLPGVYTLEIQQGNIITQEQIDQLRPQMTKRQVLYIMGSSMLIDTFHQQRWDYIQSEQPSGEDRTQERLSLIFDENNKLSTIQGDLRPSATPTRKKSTVTTVEVPTRYLDNTLWGRFIRLFDDPPQIDENKNSKEGEDNLSDLI